MRFCSRLGTMALIGLAIGTGYAQLAPKGRGLVRQPAVAPPIFYRAVNAVDHLRYSGERVVEFQRGPTRQVHNEYVLHDGTNSRVRFPIGSQFEGQIIIETAEQRLHYYPRRNEVEVLPPKQEEAFARVRQWLLNRGRMRLSTGPGDVVAGRQTELGIVADPSGNVVQRLWIDPQTGLVLKRELLDKLGARVGYFEFLSIDYNPVVHASDFTITRKNVIYVTLEAKVQRLANKNNMLAITLPSGHGFQLDNVNMVPGSGRTVMLQSYSGPRGKLSLFQVAGWADPQNFERPAQKELQYYGWQMSGHGFALVGNYPLELLKQLASLVGDNRNGP